jgi:hypothetical protein
MGNLSKLKLPNGVEVYVQSDEDDGSEAAQPGSTGLTPPGTPVTRRRGADRSDADNDSLVDQATRRARSMTAAIEGIAAMIPTAFKHAGGAEVEKITLSFGIKAGGKAGIPMLTEGSAEGSIGVVLECRYPPSPEVTRSEDD